MRRLATGLGILAILAALGGDAEAWVRGGAAAVGGGVSDCIEAQDASHCIEAQDASHWIKAN